MHFTFRSLHVCSDFIMEDHWLKTQQCVSVEWLLWVGEVTVHRPSESSFQPENNWLNQWHMCMTHCFCVPQM
jgi:hypothetical protein